MPFGIALAFTLAGLWLARRLALRCGFADHPGGRKRHELPVPPVGGLVILPVFLIVARLAGFDEAVPLPLILGVTGLLVMGAVDDAFPLKAFLKFGLMILAAAYVVIFGDAQIAQLGNLFGFGLVELGIASKAFTIMALVLLMNAINMADGVDGLAGGICATVVFWMMVYCAGAGLWDWFGALAVLMACLAGFLFYNMRAPWRRRASIFLGDAGALSLGLVLGWFCIRLTQGEGAPIAPASVIWIIGLPVIDAFALFIARSARGLHPFNADRRHLHHRFLDAGVMAGRTTVLILAMVAFMGLVGFAWQKSDLPPAFLFYGWMAVFILHTGAIMHPRGYTLWSRLLRVRNRAV